MVDSSFDCDCFVIGCGSGGVRAARIAAGYGARVIIADDLSVGLGGTCVNVGCVPKKLMVYGSEVGHHWHEARGFGWEVGAPPAVTWPRLIANKNAEISRLNGIYKWLVESQDTASLIQQRASITGPHTVTLADGTKKTAEKILIAVGGWPYVPDVPGGGKEHIITSNEVFFLPAAPKKVVIWGAGYIAVEMAGIFKGYGAEVHIVLRKAQILRGFDDDTRVHLRAQMEAAGYIFHAETDLKQVDKVADGSYRVHLAPSTASGPAASVVECDLVLGATGRKPKTAGLGLDTVGVALNRAGEIETDADGMTSVSRSVSYFMYRYHFCFAKANPLTMFDSLPQTSLTCSRRHAAFSPLEIALLR